MLEQVVQHMLGEGACLLLFLITYNTYEQLALEVLDTFELSLGTVRFHCTNIIHFKVFGALYWMSLAEFSIQLRPRLYDVEFTRILAYDTLLISRPIKRVFGGRLV